MVLNYKILYDGQVSCSVVTTLLVLAFLVTSCFWFKYLSINQI